MVNECNMEKILRVPLAELQTIRLVCKRENCGGVAEMPTTRLEALVGEVLCPSCGKPMAPKSVGAVAGFKALGMSLRNIEDQASFAVEFVIRIPGDES
jgi:hypothetical protein